MKNRPSNFLLSGSPGQIPVHTVNSVQLHKMPLCSCDWTTLLQRQLIDLGFHFIPKVANSERVAVLVAGCTPTKLGAPLDGENGNLFFLSIILKIFLFAPPAY